jgi:hypothetical protein
MKLDQKIKNLLKQHPHWGPSRIAEELGTSPKSVSVTASTNKIKFLNTREIEDMVDEVLHGKAE